MGDTSDPFLPVASTLCLLSELVNTAKGTKVRFLGCVERYDIASATLILKSREQGDSSSVSAAVKVEPILESLSTRETEVGAWVNVIGYRQSTDGKQRRTSPGRATVTAHVDAVMVWSAGALVVADYDNAVKLRKELEAVEST